MMQEETEEEEAQRRRDKKRRKKERRERAEADVKSSSEEATTTQAPQEKPPKKRKRSPIEEENLEVPIVQEEVEYPYAVEDNDHCESPLEAYRDISGMLDLIAQRLGKSKASLRIYDPFYCEGSMLQRLASLGFETVYNKKEDFYALLRQGATPAFDVLVTNPPYSGDHIPNLLAFCASIDKPWFLLLPNFVYAKDYYSRSLVPKNKSNSKKLCPFYVCPLKRYLYTTPKGRRQEKSAKYTSPFPSFWYCHTQHIDALVTHKQCGAACNSKAVHVSYTESQLPLEVLPESDARKKKERNNKKREKNKKRKKSKQSVSSGSTA